RPGAQKGLPDPGSRCQVLAAGAGGARCQQVEIGMDICVIETDGVGSADPLHVRDLHAFAPWCRLGTNRHSPVRPLTRLRMIRLRSSAESVSPRHQATTPEARRSAIWSASRPTSDRIPSV